MAYKKHKIIKESATSSLLYFKPKIIKNKIPIYIQPPFAGRKGDIVQNLIDKCVDNGRHTYVFDLKNATPKTSQISISDLINIIHGYVSIIGQVDICGTCQGGWLSAIYVAMYPEKVRKYAIFAAPINTKTGEDNIIEKYCETADMKLHESLVALNGGVQAGSSQYMSFIASNPKAALWDRFVKSMETIMTGDMNLINKRIDQNNWYDQPQNIAGTWFLEAMSDIFIGNKLFKKAMKINNRIVDLANIKCPIFVYSGANDEITHSEQMRSILDVVSSDEKHYIDFKDTGHTLVFAGKKQLEYFAKEFLYD